MTPTQVVSILIEKYDLDEKSVILSLGTHTGSELMPLAEIGAEIHCFEPHPKDKPALETRFKAFPNVHLNFAAAWVENTAKPLYYKNEYQAINGGASLFFSQNVEQTDIVTCINIAQYIFDKLAGKRIDLMLMDVEGAEYLLLYHLIDKQLIHFFNHIYFEDHTHKVQCVREDTKPDWYLKYKDVVFRFCDRYNIKLYEW